MRTVVMACCVSLLAVSFCAASLRRPSLAMAGTLPVHSALFRSAKPAARARPRRKSFRPSARLRARLRTRDDEPILVIYGERPGSWM